MNEGFEGRWYCRPRVMWGVSMKRLLSLVALIAASVAVVSGSLQQQVRAADPAPYYENLTQSCTASNGVKPCHTTSGADEYFVRMAQCSDTITGFCYTATKSDGTALPETVKILAGVSAYKVHTSTVEIAGYESFVNAYYVAPTATLGNEYFGSSDRPADQPGNGGKLDLSPALTANDSIKVVLKYKATGIPQYSVLVADGGTMDFSLTGQDVSVTLEGKPARVAIESTAQHINFDTEKSDDTSKPWTDRCGIPSMNFVVCNVNAATSDALAFYARTKTFVFGRAAESPAPIWVSTNATYFHFPSITVDQSTGAKSVEVKTAAPHLLSDGNTLHTGNFSAFIPNGVLSDWQVEKTEASLKSLLSGTVEKEGKAETVTPTFVIGDTGVKVVFPKISYSAPVVRVGKSTASSSGATTTPSSAVNAPVKVPAVKTLKKGKSTLLKSLIKPVGAGKQTWRVKGGCKISGPRLVAPRKTATCTLTLRQAKSGKRAASTKTITIKVR